MKVSEKMKRQIWIILQKIHTQSQKNIGGHYVYSQLDGNDLPSLPSIHPALMESGICKRKGGKRYPCFEKPTTEIWELAIEAYIDYQTILVKNKKLEEKLKEEATEQSKMTIPDDPHQSEQPNKEPQINTNPYGPQLPPTPVTTKKKYKLFGITIYSIEQTA